MSLEEFKQEHMLKLQGKEYLPVAPRVLLFRKDHPDYSIQTSHAVIQDKLYVLAAISDSTGRILSMGHKMVKQDARGPAALWPLETAETGAVGRALALLGYGTLAGDLDEGEQLADAPQAPQEKAPKKRGRPKKAEATPTQSEILQRIKDTTTLDELSKLKDEVRGTVLAMEAGDPQRKAIVEAAAAREAELNAAAG